MPRPPSPELWRPFPARTIRRSCRANARECRSRNRALRAPPCGGRYGRDTSMLLPDRRKFRRVMQQVLQHLHEPRHVAAHDQRIGRHMRHDALLVRVGERPRGFDRARHHFGQIDARKAQFDLVRHDPADIEQIVDQTREVRDLPVDQVARARQRGTHAGFELHHADRIAHRRKRIAQLMRERREKLAHAFAGALQFFTLTPLGQIARHLGETAQPVRFVMHGGDIDVGPEGRAVLAHAPAFVLDVAELPGNRQFARGLARRRHLQADRTARNAGRRFPRAYSL